MIKIKYNRCEYDNCVYFKQNDDLTYLVLYVDNMLIAVRNKIHIQKLKAQLKKEFNMKDLGEVKKILGMKITWDTGMKITWAISRELHYECVGKIQHDKSKIVTTLLTCDFKLSSKQCPQSPKEDEEMSQVPYASAVGSLMVCTRLDLSYAVSAVSQFISNPEKEHWEAVKWVLWYIWGTARLNLVF